MKICFLTERLLKGYGVDIVVHNQATLLSQKGHEIIVVTSIHDAEYYKNTVYNIKIMPYGYKYKNIITYIAFIKKEKFDYVIAHTPDYYFLLPTLNKYTKTVVYEHGTPDPEYFPSNIRTGLQKMIENKKKYLYSNVDAVYAISDFIKNGIGNGFDGKRTIYNGTDHFIKTIEAFNKNILLGEDNKIKILTVCRIDESASNYKGLDTFKLLADYLNTKSDKYGFYIAGKGNETDKGHLEQLGFKVILSPTDQQMQACYNSCDVFVHFSKWEGFNLPLAEAEWCKKPALAIAIGAHPEVTPFTFSNYKEMADFILSKNMESLAEIGEKCFLHVQKFTWENNVKELEKTLLDIKHKRNKGIKFSYYYFFAMYYIIKPAIRTIINPICSSFSG